MKTRNMAQLLFIIFLLAVGCGDDEFDPGPFARDKENTKTLLTFNVSDVAGNPIEDAYVVSYRSLAPKHIRIGEGFTNEQGEIEIEDPSHSKAGYATVVAPGYNSRKIMLDIEANQENNIDVTLAEQDVLKIMSYNIEEGFKNNAQQRHDFANWVAQYDPDIILLQEMMHFTDASFAAFAKTYGHDYAVLSKTVGFPTGITSKQEIKNIKSVIKTGILHHGYVTG